MNTKAFLIAGFIALVFGAAHAQAHPTQYSGQATVVRASVLGVETELVNAGPLPAEGGAAEDTLLEAQVPGLLTAQILHASTVGQGQRSESEASVASLSLTAGGNTIAAGFLMARARAECHGGNADVSGSSEIASLVINGRTITVSGEPNQTIQLLNGRVVINEQNVFVDDNLGDIVVNALHVTVFNPLGGSPLVDVVVSSAHADILCAEPSPGGGDFVTGGGWITGTPTGAKANFGVAGGIKNNALWGHLTYIDHGTGMKVKGTSITGYFIVGDPATSTTRRIEGAAELNRQGGYTFVVEVSDNGEPGRDDTFSIRLSNGYQAAGRLGGGNIQLHAR